MKKIIAIIFLVTSLFAETYTVENRDSKISFDATKLLFVGVSGEFKKFQGEIVVEGNKLVSINGTIDIDTIFTANQERDTHLKADDYFYESKYPKIHISTVSADVDTLVTKVTIKGITKEIGFKIDEFLVSDSSVKLSLSTKIDRQEFMLNGSMSAIMNDNVTVTAMLSASK